MRQSVTARNCKENTTETLDKDTALEDRALNQRERIEYEQFLAEEKREADRKAAKLQAEIDFKKLEQEVSRNAGAELQKRRQLAVGYQESPYVSKRVANIMNGVEYMSPEDRGVFARSEAQGFRSEVKEFEQFNNQQSIDIMLEVYTRRFGEDMPVDREMLKSIFYRLKADNLLTPNPVPVPRQRTVNVPAPIIEDLENLPRTPESLLRPANGLNRRDTSGQMGIGEDGKEQWFDDISISRMTSEQYRRCFLPQRVLGRFSFERKT
jgi:hypothetical protein